MHLQSFVLVYLGFFNISNTPPDSQDMGNISCEIQHSHAGNENDWNKEIQEIQ